MSEPQPVSDISPPGGAAPTLVADDPALNSTKPPRISCDGCRIRKIRCLAEKPICGNCSRKGQICTYPVSIRRRGPDKQPGGRMKHKAEGNEKSMGTESCSPGKTTSEDKLPTPENHVYPLDLSPPKASSSTPVRQVSIHAGQPPLPPYGSVQTDSSQSETSGPSNMSRLPLLPESTHAFQQPPQMPQPAPTVSLAYPHIQSAYPSSDTLHSVSPPHPHNLSHVQQIPMNEPSSQINLGGYPQSMVPIDAALALTNTIDTHPHVQIYPQDVAHNMTQIPPHPIPAASFHHGQTVLPESEYQHNQSFDYTVPYARQDITPLPATMNRMSSNGSEHIGSSEFSLPTEASLLNVEHQVPVYMDSSQVYNYVSPNDGNQTRPFVSHLSADLSEGYQQVPEGGTKSQWETIPGFQPSIENKSEAKGVLDHFSAGYMYATDHLGASAPMQLPVAVISGGGTPSTFWHVGPAPPPPMEGSHSHSVSGCFNMNEAIAPLSTPNETFTIVDYSNIVDRQQNYYESDKDVFKTRGRKRKAMSSEFTFNIKMYTTPGDIQKARDGWWSWILAQYGPDRSVGTRKVMKACNSFFTDTYIWLNFSNKALFFSSLFDQTSASGGSSHRTPLLRAAPHVILAILALVTIHHEGHTPEGHTLALRFYNEAQSLLAFCINAGSQDPSLVAAALCMFTFELQPHREHLSDRVASSITMLESVGLTVFSRLLDADDVRVSTSVTGLPRLTYSDASSSSISMREKVQVEPHITKWAQVPAWGKHWSDAELWKEEMRRMCWTASSMAATFSLWRFMQGKRILNLEISHPEKFRLFFPGEAAFIEQGDIRSGKTTPWALYQRLISLWHFIINNRPITDSLRNEVVRELEAVEEDIQIFLDREGVRSYIWQSIDWTMIIRRVLGVMNPFTLSRWFSNELRMLHDLGGSHPGMPEIRHRPVFCWWFVIQAYSALELSRMDKRHWDDANQIYQMAMTGLESIIDWWKCKNVLQNYLLGLQDKYTEILEERRRVLDTEAKGSVVGVPMIPAVSKLIM